MNENATNMGGGVKTIQLSLGQVVEWKASPSGYAQVQEFRRTRVRICYERRGRICHTVVAVRQLTVPATLFPITNPFKRAFRPKTRVFRI
jgi:hypothetical protein